MSFLFDRFLCRARFANNLIEDWQIRHNQATIAADVDELAHECIELATLGVHAWKRVRELLRSDPNGEEIHLAGKIMKIAMPRMESAFKVLPELIAGAKRNGGELHNTAGFENAAKSVIEIRRGVDIAFPELNQEMAETCRVEIERGEYQTIEELLREVQGHRAAAH